MARHACIDACRTKPVLFFYTYGPPKDYDAAKQSAISAKADATANDAEDLCPIEWNAAEDILRQSLQADNTKNWQSAMTLMQQTKHLYDVARMCAIGKKEAGLRRVERNPVLPSPSSTAAFAQEVPLKPIASTQKRVAVLDLRNEAKLPDSDVAYLGEVIRTGARKALPLQLFILMTKENIQQLLPPERRDLRNCEGQCEVETGRLLSADYLVTGSVVRFGGELRITVRLYEIASGNLLDSKKASGNSVLEFEGPVEAIAQTLFESIQPHGN